MGAIRSVATQINSRCIRRIDYDRLVLLICTTGRVVESPETGPVFLDTDENFKNYEYLLIKAS
ncbi:MAG: hypothetical protein Ct9H300mP19_00250 [Dehalococcoidia bacterium]|nr:MAG: hypothetical protein Ct9H300mP19_00250 [Dehalococcoidia bacterium]